MHRALLGCVAVVVTACASAQTPRTCRSSAGCKDGEACIIGACAPAGGAAPIAATTKRVVLDPEAMALVTTEDDDGGTPPVVHLGAAVGPRARILLKFPKQQWAKDAVVRAFLVLDRAAAAQAGPGDVVVRAARIVAPWSAKGGAGVTWASPPDAEPLPGAEANVAARGNAPIRIDVTPYAVELGKKTAKPWGLRVEAKGEGFGVPIATGASGGAPPRLEVYLQ